MDADHPTAVEDRDDGLRVFFSTADDRGRAANHLGGFDPPLTCTPVDVPDEGWAERSQADLGPVQVGRLTIDPGRSLTIQPGADLIVIRPSMGFGTGHHASTRRCLALLQAIRLTGRRVLDVGTGSGVLAIAAVTLGAASALGIDPDPDALVAAAESIDANRAGDRVQLAAVDLAESAALPGAPFDVVVANLTGALLVREAAALARVLRPDGRLIVSGFMTDEQAAVTAAFAAVALAARASSVEDGWVGGLYAPRAAGHSIDDSQ